MTSDPKTRKNRKQPLRPDFCTKHKIECNRDGKERQTLPSIITPVLIPNQGGHITVFKLGAIRKNLSLKRSWWQLLSRPGAQRGGPRRLRATGLPQNPLAYRGDDVTRQINVCTHKAGTHKRNTLLCALLKLNTTQWFLFRFLFGVVFGGRATGRQPARQEQSG